MFFPHCRVAIRVDEVAVVNGLRTRINEERNRHPNYGIKGSDLIVHYLATELSTAEIVEMMLPTKDWRRFDCNVEIHLKCLAAMGVTKIVSAV